MKNLIAILGLSLSTLFIHAETHPTTGCYWEWMNGNISKEGITKDLEYMKAAGIESAFIFDAWVGIERGPIDYGSREWTDAVKHACKEARRLGIVLGLHNSPGYTAMGGPWIKPDESMKQLTWSVSSKKNPPVPKHKMGFYRDIKTFRTTCADEMQDIGKRLEKGESVVIALQKEKPVVGFNLWRGEREKPEDPFDGPRDYAPRLTVEVSSDGNTWTNIGTASGPALRAHDIPIYFMCDAKTCRYLRLTSNRGTNLDRIEILTAEGSGTTYRRVGYTTNGQMVTAASEAGLGLEVDKLSRKGVEAHFDRFLGPLLDELREYCGTTLRYVLVDSWEAGRQDWTESFGTEYLTTGDGHDFLHGGLGKQNATKQRLFMQEFVMPLKEKLHAYGLELAGEPYGNGDFDRKEYGLSLDLPMSEYWARSHYGNIERPRFVSRYGLQAGRKVIGCEFGTAYPGDADIPAVLSSFKEDIDKVVDAGVNFFVLHCVALQDRDDRPMTMGPFGTRFDRLHANVDSVKVITDYIRQQVANNKSPRQQTSVRRVLYIGDSITDGAWGNSGGSGKPSDKRNHWDQNHLLGHGYVYLCAARYTADHPAEDVTFMNRGISGDSLMGLKARWQQDVITLKPDLLSVLIGTNDVNEWLRHGHQQPFDFTGWELTYRSLLNSAKTANPDIHLVLCSPFVAPSGKVGKAADFALRQETIAQLRDIVERIARDYNASFVDFNALYTQLQQQAPRPDYWIWDGIHPTPAGHQQMADLWMRMVAINN